MPDSHGTSSHAAHHRPIGLRGDLKFTFNCPKCDDRHAVEWKNLGKIMRCLKCGSRFRINHNQIAYFSEADLPHISYVCPRCKVRGSVAANVAERGVECVRCNLPLFLAPNGQLCSAEELAALLQARLMPKPVSRLAATASFIAEQLARPFQHRLLRWPMACCFLICALAGTYRGVQLLQSLRGPKSVADMAYQFTLACLNGEKDEPLAYIADDPAQRNSFKSFQIIHFASLHARVRPPGDRVTVRVEPLQDSPEGAKFSVVVESDSFGERQHSQCWVSTAGRWYFDAKRSFQD